MTRRPVSKLAGVAVMAAALAATLPDAASADALTYADGDNVWVASPDGAVKRAVTTDGQANDYYAFPSLDDAGNVVAIKGYSATKAIVVVHPNGTRTVNVMPWKTSTVANIGPTAARVKPTTGTQLAYTYLWNHGPYSGYPNGGLESRFALVNPEVPGNPTNPVIDQPGKDALTWHGDRLVGSDGSQIVYEYEPLKFRSWLSDNTGASLVGAEVSRDGKRVLVAYGDNRLALLAYQGVVGDPTAGSVTDGCYVPVQAPAQGRISWALSPDGHRVAWGDVAGLHVASIEAHPGPGNGPCELVGHELLSATGKQPAFSAAPAPTNGTGPVQGPGGSPTPDPVVKSDPVVTTATTTHTTNPTPNVNPTPVVVPATATVAGLGRGLAVSVKVRSAGRVTATLSAGRVLGTATAVARRAGTVRLTIRLGAAAKRRLAALKGRRVTLRLVFAPRAGKRITTTRTLRVR